MFLARFSSRRVLTATTTTTATSSVTTYHNNQQQQYQQALLPTRYITTASIKPNVSLISKLRKETQCSLGKAREALMAAENQYDLALQWLEKDAAISGAKRAAKLDGRTAQQGIVAVAGGESGVGDGQPLMSGRSVMIEVNCETDFVAKSEMFLDLVRKIVWTAYIMADNLVGQVNPSQGHQNQEKKQMSSSTTGDCSHTMTNQSSMVQQIDPQTVLECPFLPFYDASPETILQDSGKKVNEIVLETIGKLGENIQLRRVVAIIPPKPASVNCATCANSNDKCNEKEDKGHSSMDKNNHVILSGAYVHGASGLPKGMGRIGSIVSIKIENILNNMTDNNNNNHTFNENVVLRKQHIKQEFPMKARQLAQHIVGMNPSCVVGTEDSLYEQDFLLGGGTVKDILNKMKFETGHQVEVTGFTRFECGRE